MQERFAEACPSGWTCEHEADVLDKQWQRTLGHSARADVLLSREDGSRRIWIESEVSPANPVANHAKFATSHLFQPQPATDTFVAMVSPHVTPSRRNLAANTILLMRRVGMSAFQTVLFPTFAPTEIKRLNHLSASDLATHSIDTASELTRALTIANPLPHPQLMSLPLYTSLDESEPKFDGNLAQTHLQRQLNMRLTTPDESPGIAEAFTAWQATQSNHIRIHPKGPLFLVASGWFG